jgi:hypothetical protein
MHQQPPPNFLPPVDSKGPLLIIVTGIRTALSIITTSLRLSVPRANHQLGWDDYLIVAATVIGVACMGVQIVTVQKDNGRHMWYINQEQYH